MLVVDNADIQLTQAEADGLYDIWDDMQLEEMCEDYLRSPDYRRTLDARPTPVMKHIAFLCGVEYNDAFKQRHKERVAAFFSKVWKALQAGQALVTVEDAEQLDHDGAEEATYHVGDDELEAPKRLLKSLQNDANVVVIDMHRNAAFTLKRAGWLKLDVDHRWRIHSHVFYRDDSYPPDAAIKGTESVAGFGHKLWLKATPHTEHALVGARGDLPEGDAIAEEQEADEMFALHLVKLASGSDKGKLTGCHGDKKGWVVKRFKAADLLAFSLEPPTADVAWALNNYGAKGGDFSDFHQTSQISKDIFSATWTPLFKVSLVTDMQRLFKCDLDKQGDLLALWIGLSMWHRTKRMMEQDNQAAKSDGVQTKAEELQTSLINRYQASLSSAGVGAPIPRPTVPIVARQRHGGSKAKSEHTGFTPDSGHEPKRKHTGPAAGDSSASDAATEHTLGLRSKGRGMFESDSDSPADAFQGRQTAGYLREHRDKMNKLSKELVAAKEAKDKMAQTNTKYRDQITALKRSVETKEIALKTQQDKASKASADMRVVKAQHMHQGYQCSKVWG